MVLAGDKLRDRVLKRAARQWVENLEDRVLLSVNSFDFSQGFTGNGIAFNGGADFNGTAIQLASTSSPPAAQSVFYSALLPVKSFATDFTVDLSSATDSGFTFTIQGDGVTTVGGSGPGLGYAGIAKSAAITFDIAGGASLTSLSTAGVLSTTTSDLTNGGLNLHNGNPVGVRVTYSGTTLSVTEEDLTTGANAAQTYTVNLATVVGSNQAYFGFTSGTATSGMNASLAAWDYADTTGTPAIGINLNGDGYNAPEILFANAMKTASAWGSVANPGDASAPVDANGWPTTDAGVIVAANTGTDLGGTYALSFTGQATVTPVASTATVTNQVYNSTTNTTTANIVVQKNSNLELAFTNTRRLGTDTTATGITNVQVMRPTAPEATTSYSPTVTFTTPIVTLLSKFSTIRFTDYEQTNNSTVTNWLNRTLPGQDQANANGGSWEYAVALANATNTDMWINIPEMATNSYINNLAKLIRYGSDGVNPYSSVQANPLFSPLKPNLHVYIEYSNEVWNTSFAQSAQNQTAALAAAAGGSSIDYDGTTDTPTLDIRHTAERIKQTSDIFRSVFGDAAMMTTVRPVFEWQNQNLNNTAEIGLDYLNNYYNNADGTQHVLNPHPVDYYLWGGGGAWYSRLISFTGTGDVTLTNSSFESPTVLDLAADPAGAGWTFAGTAGLAANGSTLGNANAPDGNQVGYIQGTGSFSETAQFSGGLADLAVNVAIPSGAANKTFDVYFDNNLVGAFTASLSNFTTARTLSFNTGATAGTHTLTIVGVGGGGTVFFDTATIESANGFYNSGLLDGVNDILGSTTWSSAYGLHDAGYEGGFEVGGDSPTDLQTQANLDPRAQQEEVTSLDEFFQAGGDLAMVYTAAGLNAYGITPNVTTDLTSPKIQGIEAVMSSGLPGITVGTLLPTVGGQSVTIPEAVAGLSPSSVNAAQYVLLATGPWTYTVTLHGTQVDPNASVHLMLDGVRVPYSTSFPLSTGSAGNSSPALTFSVSTPGLHTLSLFVDGPNVVQLDGGPVTITAVQPLVGRPTLLSAVAENAIVSLTWTAVPYAMSYNIYRSTSSGTELSSPPLVISLTGLSYTDTTVSNGTTYYYVVTAVGPRNESVPSNELSALPLPPTQLIFAKGPVGVPATTTIPPILVDVENMLGSIVTNDFSTVKLTLTGGTFSDGSTTATSNAVDGIATFTGLVINVPGSGYSLTATDGNLTQAISPNFTIGPVPVSLSNSVVTVSPGSVVVGSTSTITLQAYNTLGMAMTTGGLVVTFTLGTTGTDTGTISAVVDHGNGTYTATFTGKTAGSANPIITKIGGGTATAAPTITVTAAPVSLSNSKVTVSPSSVLVGATSTITLQAYNTLGAAMTSGGLAVSFTLGTTGTDKGTISAVVDHGNGTYTATFTGTTAGSANPIVTKIGGGNVTSTEPTITVTASAAPEADLSITLTGPASAAKGTTFTYTLTVTNNGPATSATGFTISDNLPAGLTFQATGSTAGERITGQSIGYVRAASLAAGQSRVYLIHVLASSTLAKGAVLKNSASVATRGTADPKLSNNVSNVVTTTIS